MKVVSVPESNGDRVCGAKTRSGKPCRKRAVRGMRRCRNHGGASLVGIANPNWKHGRYSSYLPRNLAKRYREAVTDPSLVSVVDELALVVARQQCLLEQLKGIEDSSTHDAVERETAIWAELTTNLELYRRLVETRFKLTKKFSVDDALTLVTRIGNIVKHHVADEAILDAIADDFCDLQGLPIERG